MATTFATFLRSVKLLHAVFSMPFAWMGAFLAAPAAVSCGQYFLVLWCTLWGHCAGMMFNRIADAKFDKLNPRTAGRDIPAGTLSSRAAKSWLGLCAVFFVMGATAFWLPVGPYFGYGNYLPVLLVLPALLFICLYSLSKRFTSLSHFWIGASLMLAPLGAFLAVSGSHGPVTSVPVILLSLAVLFWVAGFDIFYACQDLEFDRTHRLHSIPARLGKTAALHLSRLCHIMTIVSLAAMGPLVPLNKYWYLALGIVSVLMLMQHILIACNLRRYMTLVFDGVNTVISFLLAAALAASL